jgi:hypothetical protein
MQKNPFPESPARLVTWPARQPNRDCEFDIDLNDLIVSPQVGMAYVRTDSVADDLWSGIYPPRYLQSEGINGWSYLLGAVSEPVKSAAQVSF